MNIRKGLAKGDPGPANVKGSVITILDPFFFSLEEIAMTTFNGQFFNLTSYFRPTWRQFVCHCVHTRPSEKPLLLEPVENLS